MTSENLGAELCDCKVTCCLHGYAEAMLAMLYRYASECGECEGEGEVVISSVRRDVDWYDEITGPCGACADIRAIIKMADPCGDRLSRAEKLKREVSEGRDDGIAF